MVKSRKIVSPIRIDIDLRSCREGYFIGDQQT